MHKITTNNGNLKQFNEERARGRKTFLEQDKEQKIENYWNCMQTDRQTLEIDNLN